MKKNAYNPQAHERLARELARKLAIDDTQTVVDAARDQDALTSSFWDPKVHARAHETRTQMQRRVDTETARVRGLLVKAPGDKATLRRLGRLSHMAGDLRAHHDKTRAWVAGRDWARGSHGRGMLVNLAEHIRQPDIDRLDPGALDAQRQLAARLKTAAFAEGVKTAFSTIGLTLAAGSGILAIYDLMRANGYERDAAIVRKAIANGELVDSRQFVARIDNKIIVCTTGDEVSKALGREPNMGTVRRLLVVSQVRSALKQGNNAFAMRGEKGDYIFAPARTGAEVLAHEVGHILDFRAQKIDYRHMGPYESSILDQVWKPSFESHTLDAERHAWARAPGHKAHSPLEQAALGTYEKSFHGGRGMSAATLAVLLAAGSLAKVAANPGSYEADVSAPGVTATNTDLPRAEEQTVRKPGNARKGRGVPEWMHFSKYLPSAPGAL